MRVGPSSSEAASWEAGAVVMRAEGNSSNDTDIWGMGFSIAIYPIVGSVELWLRNSPQNKRPLWRYLFCLLGRQVRLHSSGSQPGLYLQRCFLRLQLAPNILRRILLFPNPTEQPCSCPLFFLRGGRAKHEGGACKQKAFHP
jgi:hypothetical protein